MRLGGKGCIPIAFERLAPMVDEEEGGLVNCYSVTVGATHNPHTIILII